MKTRIPVLDLHMHSTVSDGTDTPEALLAHVRAAGIGLFSLTDHDAIEGCRRILAARTDDDPAFIPGIEFSCRDEEGQYHILGYGYDPGAAAINAVVAEGHAFRMRKITGRLDFLKERFGFTFKEEDVDRLLSMPNPGKPHIGNLMVRYGYAGSKEEAITEFINQAEFKDQYVRPETAIKGILNSGGIPVLAHPPYGSGDQLILGKALDRRVQKLVGFGLLGVEAFYSGFTKKLRNEMLALAEKYDLYVTAGSDYHGSNKLISLGDTGLQQAEEIPTGLTAFLQAIKQETEGIE
ncbi:MAG: PHP domain-containing protein [Clostridia bacterium]|nr:PHP domain-containing protein [Clostridia bacterium]